MSATPTLVVPAPAKVNLFLHVTGRRADGYHTIESLFALVDLADTVTLARRDDGAVLRTRDLPGVLPEHDLAIRAARALKEATRTAYGVDVAVEKRIPQGGGLGGGSTDAASVLLALNRLWQLGLPRAALLELAVGLGADVPFFVGGRNAIARGIGEVLTPVSLPRLWLVLVQPPVAVATAAIFAAPNLTRSTPSAKIDVFSEGYGRNDLAEVVRTNVPEVAAAMAALARVAADARMTGSGACVFAAFGSEREAHDALALLPRPTVGRVVATLVSHPLAAFA
jgi:4-diphosphocytidyl-2-C-methyl-D-erythritol kinase